MSRKKGVNAMRMIIMLLTALMALPALAQEDSQSEIFEAPEVLDPAKPHYPSIEARRGSEGWVMINYMVDTNGEVFEPTIVSSAGSESFEKAALRAMKKTKFKPAQIDGRAVEGSGYFRFTFVMEDEPGASAPFMRSYEDLTTALKQDDKDEADRLLAELSGREFFRHYESSYLSFAKSRYAAKYGSAVEEMTHLRDALRYDNYDRADTPYFPEEFEKPIRKRLFVLEINNRRYADAMLSYEHMKEAYGDDFVEPFDKSFAQMSALAADEAVYGVPLSLDENGYAFFYLHKSGFYLEAEQSTLQEIKVRCKAKYVFFAFEQDKQYQIPDSWQPCSIEILGQANEAFEIVQF